ncbi:MAG: YfhO family protein [Thomasclavelia sp.]|nr:YfhO family protein [Thomasclavelia sp.]
MKKRDYTFLILVAISLIMLVITTLCLGYQYGSKTDWFKQYVAINETTRQAFYHTGNFLPDINWQLGSGVSQYALSYYGVFHPLMFISYLLPFVPMNYYIMFSTIIMIILSVILLYQLLLNHHYSFETRVVISLCFILAAPILFHSKKQIGFINYFPFIFLGFKGIDKYFLDHSVIGIIIPVFFLTLMNYFFLPSSLIVLTLYGIYIFIKKNNQITLKLFFKEGWLFALSIILGVLLASFVLLPTGYLLINSGKGTQTFSLIHTLKLINPVNSLLYNEYGMGLCGSIVIAILYLAIHGNKEQRFLSFSILSCGIFGIILFILNGTLYIRTKVLIPFIPLALILFANFYEHLKEYEFKYYDFLIILGFMLICALKNTLVCLDFGIILLIIYFKKYDLFKVMTIATLIITLIGNLPSVHLIDNQDNQSAKNELINTINQEEKSSYKIDEIDSTNQYINYASDQMKTSIYSSIYNKDYYTFISKYLCNANTTKNQITTTSSLNPISERILGSKYIISKNNNKVPGYKTMKTVEGYTLSFNEDSNSLFYTTNNLISKRQFNALNQKEKLSALTSYTVVDNDVEDVPIKNIYSTISTDTSIDNKISKAHKQKLSLNKKAQLVLISFDVNDISGKGASITINKVKNQLSRKGHIYYNNNRHFTFVVKPQKSKFLNISFSKGNYEINNFKIDQINDCFSITRDKYQASNIQFNNNEISFDVEANQDMILASNIVKQAGYRIEVDGRKKEVMCVNTAFIGTNVKKGKHHIKIIYNAPLKREGMVIILTALIVIIVISYFQRRKKDEKHFK